MEEQNFELKALMEYNSAEEFFGYYYMLLVKALVINLTKVVKFLNQKLQKL